MSIGRWLRENFTTIGLILSLALLSAQVSFRLRPETLEFMFKVELQTLQGISLYPEFQSRILPPAILSALRWLVPDTVADKSVWYLARFLQAVVSFLVLYAVVLAYSGSRLRSLVAVALVTFAYLWTPMTHPWEYTSDFFDILFVALIVHFVLAERVVGLLLVVALAACNRQSAAFSGLVWAAVMLMRYGLAPSHWIRFLPAGACVLVAMVVGFGLRYGLSQSFDSRQQIGLLTFLQHWRWMLHPTGVVPMVLASLLVFCVALARLPRPWTADQRGLLLAALLCAIPTGVFGIAAELRIWLPCWTILAILIACGREVSDRVWLAALTRSSP